MTEAPRSEVGGDRSAALTRLWYVAAVGVVTTAFGGYLTATHHPPTADKATPVPSAEPAESMPSYENMGARRRGPNAGMYTGAFDEMNADKPGLRDPVVQTDAERQSVVTARAGRRAYDGAPPTIPHEVKQTGFPDCLSCHGEGAKVAGTGKRAPRMSHERMDSCTQCHVPTSAPTPLRPPENPVENDFAGLAAPQKGTRAWPGAPPTIPHRTLMRSECSSCHGVTGVNGIRSSHPYRVSCTQCHVGSAELDQRAPGESPPPWQVTPPAAP